MKKLLLFIILITTTSVFSQVNVISNGGLENWTMGTLDDWTVENNVTENTTDVTEGSSSALFAISDNTLKPEIISQVPLVKDVTYTVKFKFKYIDSNYNGLHPIRIGIIKSGSGTTLSSNSFGINNEWREVENNFTPDQTGDYEVSLSISTFDGEAFSVLIDDIQIFDPNTLSTQDFDFQLKENITFYPTITSDIVNVKTDNDIEVNKISIFDVKGKEYKNIAQYDDKIDVSSLSSGMYILSFSTSLGEGSTRIIKE